MVTLELMTDKSVHKNLRKVWIDMSILRCDYAIGIIIYRIQFLQYLMIFQSEECQMSSRTRKTSSNIAIILGKMKKTLQFLLLFKQPLLEPKMFIVQCNFKEETSRDLSILLRMEKYTKKLLIFTFFLLKKKITLYFFFF